jgi:hypothetical protein
MRKKLAWTLSTCLAAGAVVVGVVAGQAPTAGANPALTAHASMANGKLMPHPSGGTEVSFDDERAVAADAGMSDAPPDATATALGCANRGSATNPRANQDCTARRQAEEFISVNPADPTNIVAGQNDSRVGFNHCGFDYSLDGGTTWGDGQPGFFQHLNPGTTHSYDAASDPALAVDGTGTSWYSCVLFDVATNASGLAVIPSTPALKGSAYANVSTGASKWIVAEADSASTFYDKEFIAADPRPGQSSVYVTFTQFNAATRCGTKSNRGGYCSSPIYYSKWNGTAWSAPTLLSGSSSSLCVGGTTFDTKAGASDCNFNQGSYPVVNPADGSVFVVWNNSNTPTLVNQTLGRKINADGTLGPVVKVGKDDESSLQTCDFGRGPEECIASIHVRSNYFPELAVDPSNPSHLAAVWQDSRMAGSGTPYGVAVSQSTDGGATWTETDYLTGAAGEAYFEPAVAITQTGSLAVSFYRANAYSGTDGMGTFGYGLQAAPAGGAFGAYTPVSDSQTNPSPAANPTQDGFLGDYSNMAASTAAGSSTVYPIWSDTRNVDANGIPDEDVFIAKMAL